MKHKAYSVYDSKAEVYMVPFFMSTNGQAVRAFADAVTDGKSTFCKHPEDYTLFCIGEYDDETAELTTGHKVSLGLAIEYKAVFGPGADFSREFSERSNTKKEIT